MATQMPGPIGQNPPPTPPSAKKKGFLFWGLIGCGGMMVLVFLVVVLGGMYIWHKVPKSPAQLAAALITANNPDAEVVAIDESRGLLKVKDKKTGKEITINLEDAKKGKITFTGDKDEQVTFDAQAAGKEGLLRVQTKEGSAVLGAGIPKDLPAWVPLYPGAEAIGSGTGQTATGLGGTLQLKSADSADKILQFYQDTLKKAGMQVGLPGRQSEKAGWVWVLSASNQDNKRNLSVTLTGIGNGTQIMLIYQAGK
jgi:hypothetical protein